MRVEEIEIHRLCLWKGRPKQSRDICDLLAGSIRRFGFLVPILCDKSYRVISGHMRLLAARRIGMKTVPAIVLDLKGWAMRAFAIAEQELSRKRSWKQDSIPKHLVQLSARGFDPSTLGFDPVAIEALLGTEKAVKWRNADQHIRKTRQQNASLLTLRVPATARETITSRAQRHAKRKGIRGAGSPDLLGAMVMDLLKEKP